jgi:Zn-dependent protease/CBS domain-containing protein
MGAFGALGLFGSIVFHELSHSLVSRRHGMPIKGITLFLFGGVAEMDDEPPNPRAEFFMAVAGPLASVSLAAVFYGLAVLSNRAQWPAAVFGVLQYLWIINLVVAGFNLLPAYPLDGGRLLRAGLWKWKNDLKWSTRIASYIGSGFGILLVALGFVNIFRGSFIGGMWWILIGFFLRSASRQSYQKVLMMRALHGEKISRFMKTDVVTVDPSVSLEELVEDYIYRHQYKMLPVVEDGRLKGCVTTREVTKVPREDWRTTRVSDVLTACDEHNSLTASDDATKALSLISRSGNSRLMVVDDGELQGVVTLKDLLQFLALKLELEDDDAGVGRLPGLWR